MAGFSPGLSCILPTMKRAPQAMRNYSLTFVTAGRRRLFHVEATAKLFIETVLDYRAKGKFELYAFVVMPDHVHLLLTPAEDIPLEKAVQLIKGGFSFRLKSKLEVWDRGYFDRRVHDGEDFDTCKLYIEQNPVRGRLASAAVEYPYGPAHQPEVIDPKPSWIGGGHG
jgi:putative transposase